MLDKEFINLGNEFVESLEINKNKKNLEEGLFSSEKSEIIKNPREILRVEGPSANLINLAISKQPDLILKLKDFTQVTPIELRDILFNALNQNFSHETDLTKQAFEIRDEALKNLRKYPIGDIQHKLAKDNPLAYASLFLTDEFKRKNEAMGNVFKINPQASAIATKHDEIFNKLLFSNKDNNEEVLKKKCDALKNNYALIDKIKEPNEALQLAALEGIETYNKTKEPATLLLNYLLPTEKPSKPIYISAEILNKALAENEKIADIIFNSWVDGKITFKKDANSKPNGTIIKNIISLNPEIILNKNLPENWQNENFLQKAAIEKQPKLVLKLKHPTKDSLIKALKSEEVDIEDIIKKATNEAYSREEQLDKNIVAEALKINAEETVEAVNNCSATSVFDDDFLKYLSDNNLKALVDIKKITDVDIPNEVLNNSVKNIVETNLKNNVDLEKTKKIVAKYLGNFDLKKENINKYLEVISNNYDTTNKKSKEDNKETNKKEVENLEFENEKSSNEKTSVENKHNEKEINNKKDSNINKISNVNNVEINTEKNEQPSFDSEENKSNAKNQISNSEGSNINLGKSEKEDMIPEKQEEEPNKNKETLDNLESQKDFATSLASVLDALKDYPEVQKTVKQTLNKLDNEIDKASTPEEKEEAKEKKDGVLSKITTKLSDKFKELKQKKKAKEEEPKEKSKEPSVDDFENFYNDGNINNDDYNKDYSNDIENEDKKSNTNNDEMFNNDKDFENIPENPDDNIENSHEEKKIDDSDMYNIGDYTNNVYNKDYSDEIDVEKDMKNQKHRNKEREEAESDDQENYNFLSSEKKNKIKSNMNDYLKKNKEKEAEKERIKQDNLDAGIDDQENYNFLSPEQEKELDDILDFKLKEIDRKEKNNLSSADSDNYVYSEPEEENNYENEEDNNKEEVNNEENNNQEEEDNDNFNNYLYSPSFDIDDDDFDLENEELNNQEEKNTNKNNDEIENKDTEEANTEENKKEEKSLIKKFKNKLKNIDIKKAPEILDLAKKKGVEGFLKGIDILANK